MSICIYNFVEPDKNLFANHADLYDKVVTQKQGFSALSDQDHLAHRPYTLCVHHSGTYDGAFDNLVLRTSADHITYEFPSCLPKAKDYIININVYADAEAVPPLSDSQLETRFNSIELFNSSTLEALTYRHAKSNSGHNRYNDVDPCDQGLVHVSVDHGKNAFIYCATSYVNASRVDMFSIACQAPFVESYGDALYNFWLMVIENASTILGLTKPPGCFWPTERRPIIEKDLTITLQSIEEIGRNITIRKVLIDQSNREGRVPQQKEVCYIQYNNWTDKSKPNNIEEIMILLKLVYEQCRGSDRDSWTTLCVFCMAGVGRTGSFLCLLEMVIHYIDGSIGRFDLDNFILRLRLKRNPYMVEVFEQYQFLNMFHDKLMKGKLKMNEDHWSLE
ncbi:hypothetical protein GEMRC1_006308 [Eukaryota sp. GEM-RC1]